MQLQEPIVHEFQNESSWLEKRKNGIGGSEVAVALGISPFKDPLTLYLQKKGEVERDEETERMYCGKKLEPVIADMFAEKTGLPLFDPGRFTLAEHREDPRLIATIDRRIISDDNSSRDGILEIKNIDHWNTSWGDMVPIYYQIQVQHQMGVMGLEWAKVAAFVGGNNLRIFDMQFDERVWKKIQTGVNEFFQRLQNNDPPPADGSESSMKALEILYPADCGETVVLPAEFEAMDDRRQEIKEGAKRYNKGGDLYKEMRAIEGKIKAAIGGNRVGLMRNGASYSWGRVNKKGYEVKAMSYRQLRRRKG